MDRTKKIPWIKKSQNYLLHLCVKFQSPRSYNKIILIIFKNQHGPLKFYEMFEGLSAK